MDMRKHFERSMLELLKNKSIDQITVNDLIAEVGSCKGTFYKYYIDKYDLCYKCLLNNVHSELSFNGRDWEDFLSQYIDVIDEHAKVVANAFVPSEINSPRYYNKCMVSDVLRELLKGKGLDTDATEVSFTLTAAGSLITEVVYDWLKRGRIEDKDELMTMLRASFPNSLYGYIYPEG